MVIQKQVSDVQDEFNYLRQELVRLRSEQKVLHKRARGLEKRNLLLAELNQSKDDFIAIASHQLRTPATGVKQYIGLLLEGYTDPVTPSQELFLQKALLSNDRQLQIIDDLLQVARIDSASFRLKAEEANLTQLVTQTVLELASKAKSNKQLLSVKVPKTKVKALADVAKMRMVLENLIENAINYSNPDTEIKVQLRSYATFAHISITDQGVGISKQDLSKLFQKFSRVPNSLSVEVGGTGLGLYWADKVAKLHGGSISVESTLGEGTIFTVKIPRLK